MSLLISTRQHHPPPPLPHKKLLGLAIWVLLVEVTRGLAWEMCERRLATVPMEMFVTSYLRGPAGKYFREAAAVFDWEPASAGSCQGQSCPKKATPAQL